MSIASERARARRSVRNATTPEAVRWLRNAASLCRNTERIWSKEVLELLRHAPVIQPVWSPDPWA
mgnify:CR=1 FL=1